MDMRTQTTLASIPAFKRGSCPTFAWGDIIWLLALALVVSCPMVLLIMAIGTAPVPEHLLEALAFGAAAVLAEALTLEKGSVSMSISVCKRGVPATIEKTTLRPLVRVRPPETARTNRETSRRTRYSG